MPRTQAITINQLAELCQQEKLKGNGTKKILLSSDDEGNEYHELFFGFTDQEKIFSGRFAPVAHGVNDSELKNYIVLS